MFAKVFKLIFSHKGRINRKTYLLFHVCVLGGFLLVVFLNLFVILLPEVILALLVLLMIVPVVYGMFSVSIKRFHDMNKSGLRWWIFVCLVGIIESGIKLMLIIFSAEGQNFGGFADVFLLFPGLFYIYYMCKPGTQGKNLYGEPPT